MLSMLATVLEISDVTPDGGGAPYKRLSALVGKSHVTQLRVARNFDGALPAEGEVALIRVMVDVYKRRDGEPRYSLMALGRAENALANHLADVGQLVNA